MVCWCFCTRSNPCIAQRRRPRFKHNSYIDDSSRIENLLSGNRKSVGTGNWSNPRLRIARSPSNEQLKIDHYSSVETATRTDPYSTTDDDGRLQVRQMGATCFEPKAATFGRSLTSDFDINFQVLDTNQLSFHISNSWAEVLPILELDYLKINLQKICKKSANSVFVPGNVTHDPN